MTKKQKKQLWRILLAAALFAAALAIVHFLPVPFWAGIALFAGIYLLIGWDVVFDAFKKLFTGQLFDESLLMTVASLGAFALCVIERNAETAHEAVAILLFYQVGELFQSIAVGKSRRSVSALLDMMPDQAYVERDGVLEKIDPESVQVGQTVVVRPGDRVPLDGVVLDGVSEINTAPLTGESLPRPVQPGDEVLSGCVNLSGVLRVQVAKPFAQSTASRILELVENAGVNKSGSENFITSFARIYTPLVAAAALLAALVPSLYVGFTTGVWGFSETFRPYVHAALMFLIVSCPCALVISVPMSFFGGIGGACAKGILIKGSVYVETLSKCRTIVFDKTGTLTRGDFQVKEVVATGCSEEELLLLAAGAERYSVHPLAAAVREKCAGKEIPEAVDAVEISGKGVKALVCGKAVAVGGERLMREEGAIPASVTRAGSVLHVAVDGRYAGYILVADAPKEDSASAIAGLRKMGVRTVMLTGDRKEAAGEVAGVLGVDEYEAELLPEGKLERMRALLAQKEKGTSAAFVGDGINDAPVLAGADVGFAMGALGSEAAIEAADVVLMNDKPSDVVRALSICRKTMRLVKENVVFALAVKFLVLLLLGLMTVVPALAPLQGFAGEFAVFADVGVSVIAILNAMRALR